MEQLVPDIVDNEKRQFLPAIAQGNSMKLASSIEINLHFRDRKNTNLNDGSLRDGWKTTNEQLWNGLTLKNGKLRYNTQGFNDSYADTLNHLGFTEDDIKFSKNKLKKSFIFITNTVWIQMITPKSVNA